MPAHGRGRKSCSVGHPRCGTHPRQGFRASSRKPCRVGPPLPGRIRACPKSRSRRIGSCRRDVGRGARLPQGRPAAEESRSPSRYNPFFLFFFRAFNCAPQHHAPATAYRNCCTISRRLGAASSLGLQQIGCRDAKGRTPLAAGVFLLRPLVQESRSGRARQCPPCAGTANPPPSRGCGQNGRRPRARRGKSLSCQGDNGCLSG
jgi:hypothetical protein